MIYRMVDWLVKSIDKLESPAAVEQIAKLGLPHALLAAPHCQRVDIASME